MEKRLLGILAVVLLVALPAAAQTVHVDYDKSADWNTYKTFAWKSTTGPTLSNESPLMHSRIKNAIEYQLTVGGFREDIANPDLYVTYMTDTKREVRVNTSHMGFGNGWDWDPYWDGGMTTSTTTTHTYEVGTLIIDLWDAKTNKAVFRGSAEATVKGKPDKEAKQIDKAVAKIVKKFDNMQSKGR